MDDLLYQKYLQAENMLNQGLIREGLSLQKPSGYVRDPCRKMEEMIDFLQSCGDPQKGISAVHVAGTSGKGSVAALIAGILTEAGLKVGLHVSPYLQSATEKIWVADRFISAEDFFNLVTWVMKVAKPRVHPSTPASIHGMASVAIAYRGFMGEKVDVIVVEAGCGGRYDLTSFIDTRVAVITNIGMDHVLSLGPGIEQIAWHKAGIIRKGIPVITGAQGTALKVICEESEKLKASLTQVPQIYDAREHNRQIAVKAALQVAEIFGLPLRQEVLDRGIKRIPLAGRSEMMPNLGPRVILDGAHNREKLKVAVQSALTQASQGTKVAVVGFLGSKASVELVLPLRGKFDFVVATEPRVYGKAAFRADHLAAVLSSIGCTVTVEKDPFAAYAKGVELAKDDGTVLVTGSFYLIGELRELWYPKRRVVLDRHSWPRI